MPRTKNKISNNMMICLHVETCTNTALLVMIQSPQVEALGITAVGGDP
jgi:hypothetical protein